MKLKPTIASYSGESYARIKQHLDDAVLEIIARVAQAPSPHAVIPREVVAELVEMHVLVEQGGLVQLGTAVFLRSDIENILGTVTPLAQEFARRIQACGAAFRHAPAEVTVFLAGILGVVQGMGRHMSQVGIGSAEWKEYAGLVAGRIQNKALYAAAEAANLYRQGRLHSSVITNETMKVYGDAVRAVMEAAGSYWDGKLAILDDLLRSTTSGRQGVPPGNMMMHLWRYVRKITAKALYESGFFTDSIPQDGCLTVFYENDVGMIRQLLM